MKVNISYLIIFVVFFSFKPAKTKACSCFSFVSKTGNVVAAKNYDWFFLHGHGGIYVYPRNTTRVAFVPKICTFYSWLCSNSEKDFQEPFRWSSRYGSVTFTQFGKGLPIGGMNEKGLVVEMLQLNSTLYPSLGTKVPALNESQWAAYQLDQFATTQEVVDHLNDLQISQIFIGIHYFITDAFGHTAVIEFLDGRPYVFSRENLPVQALTNTPYQEALKNTHSEASVSSFDTVWFSRTSLDRFRKVAELLRNLEQGDRISSEEDEAFQILDSVRLNGSSWDAPAEPTQWSIVYNITERKIYFKTRENNSIRELDMGMLDFNTLNRVQVLDMNSYIDEEVASKLQNYTRSFDLDFISLNRWLVSGDLIQKAILHVEEEDNLTKDASGENKRSDKIDDRLKGDL